MRARLFFIVALVMSLTSCLQNECLTVLDTEIGFTAKTSAITKSIYHNEAFSTNEMFDVWGFYSNQGDFSEFSETSTSNFMGGLTMEWTTDSSHSVQSAWRSRNYRYYWPVSGKVGFYALYPAGIASVSAPQYSGNGLQIDNYTIDMTNKFTDLMYAYQVGSLDSHVLSIDFKHALAQIEFMVQLDAPSSDYTLSVTEIDIQNVDLSAQFNYVQSQDVCKWTNNTDNQTDVIKYSDNYVMLTDEAKTYASAMVMMPQTLSGETSVRIEYKLVDAEGNVTWGETVKQLTSMQNEWKVSTKYSYLLNFSIEENSATPTVNLNLDNVLNY